MRGFIIENEVFRYEYIPEDFPAPCMDIPPELLKFELESIDDWFRDNYANKALDEVCPDCGEYFDDCWCS